MLLVHNAASISGDGAFQLQLSPMFAALIPPRSQYKAVLWFVAVYAATYMNNEQQ